MRSELNRLVTSRLRDFQLITVCNREPYIHTRRPQGVRCLEPASGVVSALDPVMQAVGGTWIGHGSGDADRENSDERGRLRVPPGRASYTLRRVWLTPEEEQGYYYGFANEALWPLCHIAYQRPTFDERDWKQYAAVNAKFADAVIEECDGRRPLVFIQDYHFALLPKLVKQRMPNAIVFQFWHIPWPNAEAFRICPWKVEILEGLLGNDLLAFHIQHHCNNFLEAIDRELESRIDREHFSVIYRGSPTLVRPSPIGVDFEAISAEADRPATREAGEALRRELEIDGLRIIAGVDRLDYTKGIPERLLAFDRLLERHPEHLKRTVLVEIGVPTRSRIGAYQRFDAEVDGLVAKINAKHEAGDWRPVVFVKEHRDRATLTALYRTADVCAVTSLHDGMNLVAKEFVAARGDRRGVLLLSPFTGAARELTQALQVNPYAIDAMAEAMHAALVMPPEEQAARMDRLRETVKERNVYAWVADLLKMAARLEPS